MVKKTLTGAGKRAKSRFVVCTFISIFYKEITFMNFVTCFFLFSDYDLSMAATGLGVLRVQFSDIFNNTDKLIKDVSEFL